MCRDFFCWWTKLKIKYINKIKKYKKNWCKIFLFFSVNVPKFSSLDTKPYIRSVYFKRLHFLPKLLRPTIQRRGKNTTGGKKRSTYFTRQEKYSGNNFFDTAVQNIYNWVFLKKNNNKKNHALYNWGVKLGSLCTRGRKKKLKTERKGSKQHFFLKNCKMWTGQIGYKLHRDVTCSYRWHFKILPGNNNNSVTNKIADLFFDKPSTRVWFWPVDNSERMYN